MTSLTELPSSGDFGIGGVVTLTLTLSDAVTVASGTPTLTLNDGGIATYTGGSGTNALTFTYTVGSGQNAAALAASGVGLNGATIQDTAGNAANLSLTGLTQSGPQINTITPMLAIDGSGFLNTSSSVSSAAVTLTTANAHDVIILDVAENGTSVSSISDTAGLTWHQVAVAGTSPDLIYQYYAIANSALSGDAITVHFSGSANYLDLNAFGISGANTSAPFDSNASLAATSNSSTVSASTSNANDLIFAAYRFGGLPTATAGSGWTAISAPSSDYYLSEYQVVSSAQTGLVATASPSNENGGIVDAVIQATVTTVSSVVESPSSGDLDAGNGDADAQYERSGDGCTAARRR